MHVGSSETNYNVIDNEVEKDVIFDIPTINASGVKGALRYFIESEKKLSPEEIKDIFGGKENDISKGNYKFLSANLMARPLRVSKGTKAYINTTSIDIVENQLQLFGKLDIVIGKDFNEDLNNEELPNNFDGKSFAVAWDLSQVEEIEGKEVVTKKSKVLEKLIGDNWALTTHDEFKYYSLPVLARNVLKEGESKNLWYEEVVPHQSIFYFIIITPDKENKLDYILENNVIQFGGNASIGQGYTSIMKVGASS